ncbi:hypothetical protein [Kribbella shirazensis]|uniref:Uncharacterized protein n=1 Tax=Kribbella shirazensis TaxID=1105143 RepID=A0A7X5VB80_9ACTN|nr:hypothetical protein [Kribbella shirazensis]NIK57337.1 hypothetical protein [Kribbella shirazensis]
MLHENVLMADIDVDQWRNAQALLLRSAKGCRRLVLIHEAGRVLKLRHTQALPVRGPVTVVEDPHQVAKDLYEANQDDVDFVVVMERDAVDSYFAQVQDAWTIEEDLDDYVRKTYAALESFPDGIVTYPGPARETLGLQWRLGASYDEIHAAVRAYVRPQSSVVLGVESDGVLWTSLVIDFDADLRVTSVTTADPSQMDIHGTSAELAERVAAWAEESGKAVSLALLLTHEAATAFLAAAGAQKSEILTKSLANGDALMSRGTASL